MDGLTKSSPTTSNGIFDAVLELSDGSIYPGISFGAVGKSVAGECVFQTGKFPVSCLILV
jgi:hypothetical protein